MSYVASVSRFTLTIWMQIETPETCPAPPEPDEYETIGQFYKAIEVGESKKHQSLFFTLSQFDRPRGHGPAPPRLVQ